MRPIVFCDYHLADNIEQFLINNLKYLKSNNYNTFIVKSEQEDVASVLAHNKELLKTLTQFINKNLNQNMTKDADSERVSKVIKLANNVKANIKLIELADQEGIEIVPTENDGLLELTCIQQHALQGKNVFAQIGKRNCEEIQMQFPQNNYVFFYSAKDNQAFYEDTQDFLESHDKIPALTNAYSIENTKLADFFYG